MNQTYEQHLKLVNRLHRGETDDDRHISWVSTNDAVGLARTPQDRIEIFLPGPPLNARYRRVRDALEHQTWFRKDGEHLLANRILLPAAGHFEQVAAFLSTELMRNGASSDLAQAFAQTEPLIDLAIEDLLIADETWLGLCGELITLHTMLALAQRYRAREIMDAWKGYRETSRDFQLDRVGVEVKTTTTGTSSHLFRGVRQLEGNHGVDDAEETSYVLMSIGIELTSADDQMNTTNLPELVDGCIEHIMSMLEPPVAALVEDLLRRIAAYGSPTSLGYDHQAMAENARFARRFRVTFARGYDMTDPNIRLLTTDDMRSRPSIDAESLHLRVNFPEKISGDVNPTRGLNASVAQILALG